MFCNGYWHMMGWMWFGWVFVLFVIGAMVWFAMMLARRNAGPPLGDTPEQIARRRYASGEIDRETYERMLQDLRR